MPAHQLRKGFRMYRENFSVVKFDVWVDDVTRKSSRLTEHMLETRVRVDVAGLVIVGHRKQWDVLCPICFAR